MSRFLSPILLGLCVITVTSTTVDAGPSPKLAKFKTRHRRLRGEKAHQTQRRAVG